jgi:uncharacterized FlgJ-related protein
LYSAKRQEFQDKINRTITSSFAKRRLEMQQILVRNITSTGLSDKQLQYEAIKAQKEIALSPNTKIIGMGVGKGNPIMLTDK